VNLLLGEISGTSDALQETALPEEFWKILPVFDLSRNTTIRRNLTGSSPVSGLMTLNISKHFTILVTNTKDKARIAKWSTAIDSRSIRAGVRRFDSCFSHSVSYTPVSAGRVMWMI
jgi:hypothetical protein